jgi:OOP family OmpA-OmpF porin
MRMPKTGAWRAAPLLPLLLLGACARWDLEPVRRQPLAGDAYQSALKAAYLDLAAFEQAEYDWRDLAFYRDRAALAGAGREVLPQQIGERKLPQGAQAELAAARERIVALYQGRGRERAPAELAAAQAAFDCWLEQQEEGHQRDHIAGCRRDFEAAIVAAEDKSALKGDLVVLLPDDEGRVGRLAVAGEGRETQVLEQARAALEIRDGRSRPVALADSEVEGIFGAALAAQPEPPRSFTLYFLEASTDLADVSKPVLDDIVSDLRRRQSPDIVVIGHTDRVGSLADNDALARRRAGAIGSFIADFLRRQGIRAVRIAAEGRGERELLVPTADAVKEPRNRRAEIVVR